MGWWLEMAHRLLPHHNIYLVTAVFWGTTALAFQSFVLWSTKQLRETEYRLAWEGVCVFLSLLLWQNSATAVMIMLYWYTPGSTGLTATIGFAISTTVLYLQQVAIPALGREIGALLQSRLPQIQA